MYNDKISAVDLVNEVGSGEVINNAFVNNRLKAFAGDTKETDGAILLHG